MKYLFEAIANPLDELKKVEEEQVTRKRSFHVRRGEKYFVNENEVGSRKEGGLIQYLNCTMS